MGWIDGLVKRHAVEVDRERTEDYIERHIDVPFHLHMSGMDRCVRQTYFTTFMHDLGHPLQREVTHPFTEYLLRIFEMGRMFEDQFYEELLTSIPEDLIVREPRLGNNVWSGKPDFVIAPFYDHNRGAIIDHKTTGQGSFAYTMKRVPRLSDALQVLAYKFFLKGETGEDMPAYLYYRDRTNHAEFEIWETDETVNYFGDINDHVVGGVFPTTLWHEMHRIDRFWDVAQAPSVEPRDIPGFKSPFEADFGCLRRNRDDWWPACRWLSHCWPQFVPGDRGPFRKPEEDEDCEVF
jgi:hypothetical protein